MPSPIGVVGWTYKMGEKWSGNSLALRHFLSATNCKEEQIVAVFLDWLAERSAGSWKQGKVCLFIENYAVRQKQSLH